MFTPQQLVWNGQLPVRFDLASNEVTTYHAPRPLFVMIPRVSYFRLLLARVVEYFEKSGKFLLSTPVEHCGNPF